MPKKANAARKKDRRASGFVDDPQLQAMMRALPESVQFNANERAVPRIAVRPGHLFEDVRRGVDEYRRQERQQELKQTLDALADAILSRVETKTINPNGGASETAGKASKGKTLRPCAAKAFSQYQHAVEQEPTIVTDDQAYDWLTDDLKADGIRLPRRDSWKRYLGRARTHYGKQKNGPRIGNETGSVVSVKRLDMPKRTKTDQS